MSIQGYIYVEAFKEAHVTEAMRGLRIFFQSKGAQLVPLREMVDAITVNAKARAAIGAPVPRAPLPGMAVPPALPRCARMCLF